MSESTDTPGQTDSSTEHTSTGTPAEELGGTAPEGRPGGTGGHGVPNDEGEGAPGSVMDDSRPVGGGGPPS